VQTADPLTAAKVPMGQLEHFVAPTAEYIPGRQLAQLVAPVTN